MSCAVKKLAPKQKHSTGEAENAEAGEAEEEDDGEEDDEEEEEEEEEEAREESGCDTSEQKAHHHHHHHGVRKGSSVYVTNDLEQLQQALEVSGCPLSRACTARRWLTDRRNCAIANHHRLHLWK